MLSLRGGDSTTAYPTAPGTERDGPRVRGALEQSSRCRAPDGSAPYGSAPRIRRVHV